MDPLRFTIAAAPLGVYLLLIAIINLQKRPFVTSGARDAAALGIGVAGLILVGPMELFFPEAASRILGYLVWVLLLVFYSLCVSLVVLLLRPRIVVYNSSLERVKAMLGDIALKIDPRSRWTGDCLLMPDAQVHLNLESWRLLRNVQLVAVGSSQDIDNWHGLEKRLRQELKASQMTRNSVGYLFLVSAMMLGIVSAVWMIARKQEVAQSVVDLLRL